MGHRKYLKPLGFTLTEVLMVISIITVMTTLVVGVSFRFVVNAKETATTATITKISGIIQDRVRSLQEFDFSPESRDLAARLRVSIPIADILVRKARFKKAFPQTFLELDAKQVLRFFGDSTTIPPTPISAPQYDPKYECGIVLYALLQKGETFGAATPGVDDFAGQEIITGPETAGLPCVVDGWREPIRFYRWPTRLIRCGETGWGDYNLNGNTTDPPGLVDLTTGSLRPSPPIRPTPSLLSSTPASLLITNLPPFDITSTFCKGADGVAGIYGMSTPYNTLGCPGSDDPEFLNTDPDDPGMLLSIYFARDPNFLTAFVVGSERDLTDTFYVNAYHDPYTYSTPLLVSAGPDRQLGLYEPTDIPTKANPHSLNFGYLAAPALQQDSSGNIIIPQQVPQGLYDNITNLNQRAGGK